jgi:hypothetical protein
LLYFFAILSIFFILFSFVLKKKKQKFKAPSFLATNQSLQLKSPANRYAQTTEIFNASAPDLLYAQKMRP